MTTEQTQDAAPAVEPVTETEAKDFTTSFLEALTLDVDAPAKGIPAAKVEPAAETKPEDDKTPAPAAETKPEDDKVEPVEPEAKVEPEVDPIELFSTEEKAALDAFDKEWPEVSQAVNLRIQDAVFAAVSHVFAEVREFVQPAMAYTETRSSQDHEEALLDAHPDYVEVYPKVKDWIKTQPPYLRAALEATAAKGGADDVIDMVSRAKKDLGITEAAPTTTKVVTEKPADAPAKAGGGLTPSNAKKAAARLSVVDTKRSDVTTGADPQDFSGSFAEALKSVG